MSRTIILSMVLMLSACSSQQELIDRRINAWNDYPTIKLCQTLMQENRNRLPQVARDISAASRILKKRGEDCSNFSTKDLFGQKSSQSSSTVVIRTESSPSVSPTPVPAPVFSDQGEMFKSSRDMLNR
jgi:hypothetical protein